MGGSTLPINTKNSAASFTFPHMVITYLQEMDMKICNSYPQLTQLMSLLNNAEKCPLISTQKMHMLHSQLQSTLVAQASFPDYHCSTFSMVPVFCGNRHRSSSKSDCSQRC